MRGADERRHRHAMLVRLVDDIARRRPERVREQPDRMRQRDLHLRARLLVRPAQQPLHARRVVRQRRHAVLPQRLFDEVAVRLRDHRLELRQIAARRRRRHHHIDAVRLAIDVLVDPVELDLELLRRKRQRAKHAHATGAADRSDDVTAVAEREDRKLDAELFADARLHRSSSFWPRYLPSL